MNARPLLMLSAASRPPAARARVAPCGSSMNTFPATGATFAVLNSTGGGRGAVDVVVEVVVVDVLVEAEDVCVAAVAVVDVLRLSVVDNAGSTLTVAGVGAELVW